MRTTQFTNCCGISIIYDMDEATPARIRDHLSGSQLNLIAINEYQRGLIEDVILGAGFKLLTTFNNGGHGSTCHLYGLRPSENPDDFQIFGDLPQPVLDPPVPAPVSVVEVEIYANLRDFGRRGPFSGQEEAREAYPKCRSFDRRDIMSDGTSEWQVNV